MRFFKFLIFLITVLKTTAQTENHEINQETPGTPGTSGLFEFPKLEWPSPKTFIGYLSNFTHRVADIVNDVKLDTLTESDFFEIPETDFELGNFTFTELEELILNSIRFSANQINNAGNKLRFDEKQNPEIDMNATELIEYNGFSPEVHHVTTEDGFILEIHRIPNDGPVYVLHHGLFCDSTNWLTNSRNESLAYILADNGFDVWMPNSRGTKYSKTHVRLEPSSPEFWNWSFEEMAEFDLPAVLDYINHQTRKKIHYVGHSQGGMIGIVALQNPKVSQLIRKADFLAPAVFISHQKAPLFKFTAQFIKSLRLIFGDAEFGDLPESVKTILAKLCENHNELCSTTLFLFCGPEKGSINKDLLPVIVSHSSSTSVKNIEHFSQNLIHKRFNRFDYGTEENLIKYGTETPPEFDLNALVVPTRIWYGKHDYLVGPEDSKHLIEILNLQDQSFELNYNHLDFLWAENVREQLYNYLID